MRYVTRRADVKYLECDSCGRRARKEKSRDPEWSKPNDGFVTSLDQSRHAAIAPTLFPFPPTRGRRV
jgi:hypothetical protein